MIKIELDEKDIADINKLKKGGVSDIPKFINELITWLRKMNDDHDRVEISVIGLIKETISGSDLLLSMAQNCKIQLSLYIQLSEVVKRKDEPYEILIP